MDAHRVSHNRQSVEERIRRFRPCTPDEIDKGALLDPPRYEINYRILKDFHERFGVVCSHGNRLRIFADPMKSAAWEEKNTAMRTRRTSANKKKTKKILGKLGDYLVTIIGSIIASIISGIILWRLAAWWRRRGKGGDDGNESTSDDRITGRQAYERSSRVSSTEDMNDVAVPRVESTKTVKEVTFVKKHFSKSLLPQVRRALLDGYEEIEWGTLIARIVDARFEGTYEQRTRAAERYLQESFGLGLDDLLSRAPMRTWYFMSNRFTRGSAVGNWVRSALAFIGLHEKKLPLTGFDVFRIMSRHTDGGIGLGISDSLQVALLWALKETGVAIQAKPSHEASDDFIKLASAFRGGRYVQSASATPFEQLMSRIKFQLRNGCRFVHEHALMAHLARYLNEEWGDKRLTFMIEDILRNADHLRVAHDLENHDFVGLVAAESTDDMRLRAIQFAVSLQKLITAKLKYAAIVEDVYDKTLTARGILEEARCNIIEALQWFSNSGIVFKTYTTYMKDVGKDIGSALDTLGRPDDGGESNGSATPADNGNNSMESADPGDTLPADALSQPPPMTIAPQVYMNLASAFPAASLSRISVLR